MSPYHGDEQRADRAVIARVGAAPPPRRGATWLRTTTVRRWQPYSSVNSATMFVSQFANNLRYRWVNKIGRIVSGASATYQARGTRPGPARSGRAAGPAADQ